MGDANVKATAVQSPSMGALVTKIMENDNAIGYASYGVSNQRAITFALAFVALTVPLVFLVIVIHVLYEARPAIQQIGGGLFDVSGSWRPLSREASYSILPMVLGNFVRIRFGGCSGGACWL